MRQESDYYNQPAEAAQANDTVTESSSAFQYLSKLPRNHNRPALDGYKRDRSSQIIDDYVATLYTNKFRSATEPFFIPVSWSMTKAALLNLLGITNYEGYEEVNGIRFYTAINDDNQLTLVAVTTMAGTGCDDDLTENEAYPYYDYADPCPSSCSSRGSLKAQTPEQKKVVAVTEQV